MSKYIIIFITCCLVSGPGLGEARLYVQSARTDCHVVLKYRDWCRMHCRLLHAPRFVLLLCCCCSCTNPHLYCTSLGGEGRPAAILDLCQVYSSWTGTNWPWYCMSVFGNILHNLWLLGSTQIFISPPPLQLDSRWSHTDCAHLTSTAQSAGCCQWRAQCCNLRKTH